MFYPKSPKKSDRQINFDTYQNIYNQVKKFQGLRFDPSVFYTMSDPSGVYVTLVPSEESSNASSEEYHFLVESNTSSTVDIHAGRWVQFYDGLDIGAGNVAVTELSVNSGTSGSFKDVKTLGGFSDGDNYLALKLNNAKNPTSMTVTNLGATYPNSGLFGRDTIVIAKVTQTSGNVASIEQYWNGADITQALTYENDDCSITRNIDDQNCLVNFGNVSARTQIIGTDVIPKQAGGTGCLEWSTWSQMKQDVLNSAPQTTIHNCDDVHDCLTNGDWFCNYFYDNCYTDPVIDHGTEGGLGLILADIKAGSCGDAHNGDSVAGGNFGYVSGVDNAGHRGANNFDSGVWIGDHGGSGSIYPHDRTLNIGTTAVVNWACAAAFTTTGTMTLDWNNSHLTNGASTSLDWSTNELKNSWTVQTNLGIGSKCYSPKFYLTGAESTDYWNTVDLVANESNSISLLGPSIHVGDVGLTYGFQFDNLGVGYVMAPTSLNLATTSLTINANPGLSTVLSYMKNNTTSGTLTFTCGILTGST